MTSICRSSGISITVSEHGGIYDAEAEILVKGSVWKKSKPTTSNKVAFKAALILL